MPEAADPKYFDLEKVYDEQIAPLMTRIIEICKAHEMPVLASFAYAYREDIGECQCTTLLSYPHRPIHPRLEQAMELARPPHVRMHHFRIVVSGPGGEPKQAEDVVTVES